MKQKNKKGFTLIELLVVVLIIGILAAVALPQYKVAVLKSEAASILPVMRAWKDALVVYKMAQGEYYEKHPTTGFPIGNPNPVDLGVIPEGMWDYGEAQVSERFYCSYQNGVETGAVSCIAFDFNDPAARIQITMYQADEPFSKEFAGKTICYGRRDYFKKVCKSLCSKIVQEKPSYLRCIID